MRDDGSSRRPAFATRREVLAAAGLGGLTVVSGPMGEPLDPGTYGVTDYGTGEYGVSK